MLAFAVGSPVAFGAVNLQSIEFSSLPGDKTEIRMKFDGAPPKPTGYTIEQPARIALDLKGVTSGLDSKYHPLGGGNARSVTVVESDGRTRVIVSMTELVAYTARVDGSSLVVLIGKDDPGMLAEQSTGVDDLLEAPVEQSAGYPQIEEVDFRRGELGEGRVIVRISDPGVGVDVSSEGGKIRIKFSDTHINESLQRRLDVTDFATPVLTVDAMPEGDDSVFMVEPTGNYDYLAYQADNIFTLEVRPLTKAELEMSLDQAFLYRGEKLSLNFQDIEIRSVLQLIADFTDLNLVASDTVQGRITLRLKNVPWDQALAIIMRTKGLDKRQVGNVLMVAPAAELAAREQLMLESQQQLSELAPLRTEFIEVRYANAANIFSLFQASGDGEGGAAGVLSARGSVIVDERTNSIILTETTDKINEFRQVLEKLDVPVRQVLIEARIVTASSNFSDQIGVRWGTLGFGSFNNGTTLTQFGGSLDTVGEVRDSVGVGSPLSFASPDHLIVDLGVGAAEATGFAVGLVDKDYLLELELSALETEGSAEVIARPKVITADKQQASISSGVQIPYQEASSSGATSVAFAEAVLGLDVRPQITPDDRIIMELTVSQDTVGAVFNGIPSINTNNIQTQVLVNNGETIVLGGIFTTQTTRSVTKTPFLGDLPYLGQLFRRNTQSDDKQELLIFITPRLIKDSIGSR
ncbi:MAG: type IV pilus secretin PilQ [Proteobacteria bacterium]|jgi:type IV pilus assembly protein PilQ|nr:type IV pilus secretin PilQ [Pseudomonadota bacterium]MDA1301772.1 type IV pilus secretin PilQ [Pseudomonadota bacterium]